MIDIRAISLAAVNMSCILIDNLVDTQLMTVRTPVHN